MPGELAVRAGSVVGCIVDYSEVRNSFPIINGNHGPN